MTILRIKPFVISLIVVLGSLPSCLSRDRRTEKEIAVDEIMGQASRKIKEKYPMEDFGSGCRIMHEVKGLYLGFCIYHQLDIQTARQILIDSAQILIDEVRNNERVQPYLLDSGFNFENASIALFIRPNHQTALDPDLSVTSCKNGVLKYKVYDKELYEEKNLPKSHTIHQETYQEAIEALKHTTPN